MPPSSKWKQWLNALAERGREHLLEDSEQAKENGFANAAQEVQVISPGALPEPALPGRARQS